MIDLNIMRHVARAVIEKLLQPRHLHLIHGNKLLNRSEMESLFFLLQLHEKKTNWNHDLYGAQYFLYACHISRCSLQRRHEILTNFMLLQVFN